MDVHQKFTFPPKNFQNVASTSADDLPEHRITLQAEDEPSWSTSHVNQFLIWKSINILRICIQFHEKMMKIQFLQNFQIFHFFGSAV